jgi:hypothetical protein
MGAVPGPGKDGQRQDQPIGGDHQDIERQGKQRYPCIRSFERGRFQNRQAVTPGQALDRRWFGVEATPLGSIGLGQNQWDFEAGRDDCLERQRGEAGSAGKADPHWVKRGAVTPRAAVSCAACS